MLAGLSTAQVKEKIRDFGYNEIVDNSKVTPLQILFRQVKHNYIIYLLAVASIISFSVGKGFTGYTILAVILVVIFTGFIQEYKAEESIASLKKMIMPITIVIRNGKKTEIESREVVPEDIVVLGNGEKIPADCLILESYNLRVNESALTGESKEIDKKATLNEKEVEDENKLYMGTFIVNGRCIAKVLHTGMNTKFGEIAHLISTTEKEYPLQEKINHITKYMVTVAIIMAIATGSLIFFRSETINTSIMVEILILTIAIAVSAFPEGLPVVLTTTLAVGSKRMSEKGAIVNRMSIIEALGETTVVCSDKTGTITRGEMTVKFIYTGNELCEVEGTGYVAHGNITKDSKPIKIEKDSNIYKLIKAGIICSDAEIERTGIDNEYKAIGTPTEAALLILGAKVGAFKEYLKTDRVSEIPFSSDRKMMSVLVEENGKNYVYTKGAPEVVLNKCTKYLKGDEVVSLSKTKKDEFLAMQSQMAKESYRTLVIAYKEMDKDYDEDELILLGLVAMEDPPRPEVEESIKTALAAGIRVVMITGDNPETANSIAKQIGLIGETMVESQIDDLSETELALQVNKINIFARVKPEHKIRIVKALMDNGNIVTMTGDGVNDAPALKAANIGVAMGKNGTDVSRSAADLILKNDSFSTIILAIAEGRNIFNNLRKFVTYQLSCNLAELVTLFIGVLAAPILGWEVPLLVSIQILFMNLVTDNLPAITLGLNPTSKDIMDKSPRKDSKILNTTLIKVILRTGSLMAVLTLAAYYISFNLIGNSTETSRTVALISLILLEIGIAFSFRSFRKFTLNRSLLVNKYLFIASVVSLLLTFVIVYTPLNRFFETVPIGINDLLLGILLMLIGVSVHDLIRGVQLKSRVYLEGTS